MLSRPGSNGSKQTLIVGITLLLVAAVASHARIDYLKERAADRARWQAWEDDYKLRQNASKAAYAHLKYGEKLLAAKKYDLALAEFAEVGRAEPNTGYCEYATGMVYIAQKRYKEAIKSFDKAESIYLAPSGDRFRTGALCKRALLKAILKDKAGALADINAALKRSLIPAEVRRYRAAVVEHFGDKAGAEADREKIRNDFPGMPGVTSPLAKLLSE